MLLLSLSKFRLPQYRPHLPSLALGIELVFSLLLKKENLNRDRIMKFPSSEKNVHGMNKLIIITQSGFLVFARFEKSR